MALRHEVSDLILAMRRLGRDIPPVIEELFAFVADHIDALAAPAPVAPEPAPAPPAPVVEPVVEEPQQ